MAIEISAWLSLIAAWMQVAIAGQLPEGNELQGSCGLPPGQAGIHPVLSCSAIGNAARVFPITTPDTVVQVSVVGSQGGGAPNAGALWARTTTESASAERECSDLIVAGYPATTTNRSIERAGAPKAPAGARHHRGEGPSLRAARGTLPRARAQGSIA
jgi:hypothetical protein